LIGGAGSQAAALAFTHRVTVPEVAMVEAVMYAAIGFCVASLLVLGIVPLLHARTERLTINRLEASLPMSLSEVQAERDLLRAEYAMAARRLELKIEHLTDKCAHQMAALGRNADLINRLEVERDTQKVEIVALRGSGERSPSQPRRLFKRSTAAASKNAA
jgi:hypothetical protein